MRSSIISTRPVHYWYLPPLVGLGQNGFDTVWIGLGCDKLTIVLHLYCQTAKTNVAEWCVETLRQYFSRYGDVVDCMVMKDPTTKRSRYRYCTVYSYTLRCTYVLFTYLLKVCSQHVNETDLNWPATRRPSYTTRSLVTLVSVSETRTVGAQSVLNTLFQCAVHAVSELEFRLVHVLWICLYLFASAVRRVLSVVQYGFATAVWWPGRATD